MAAGPEISGEESTTVAAPPPPPPAVVRQSSPKTDVTEVKINESENINVANPDDDDDDDVVNDVESKKGSDSDPKSEMKMQDIVDMLSTLKLNPMAKEFFPSSYSPIYRNDDQPELNLNFFTPAYYTNSTGDGIEGYPNNRRRRNTYSQGRRRLNGRAFRAQREDSIRRTVYVSDIDHNVTEERLAALFSAYGQVLDCRVCGDPHSRLRFAFVEFADENSARAALNLCGIMLGFSQVRVLPSKTAILPVNPTFLPRSEDEKEMCARTVYCTNIDKKVSQAEVKNFFEARCGEVSRIRLLGDHVHSTRIAFVEFVMAESAIMALDCCGQTLGSQPIRVSPSKTPVRPRVARSLPTN
ncbi:polyadenylate-binding protein-interacting protein 9-like [Cynara cardunculus var. scolymus]|uniref:polyadenylate-binding protein-interacting protein 9-like n=1 Tax=Cynara cardunculus var. scolymus TaxID=59895 RepID=UPI000D62FBE5|nr:polyadenylate-binding protein-interacting protein 9-like [Cynara cardunculus var. scolymus]